MIDGFLLKKMVSAFVQVIPGIPILLLLTLLCRRWLPTLSYALSLALVLLLLVLSNSTISDYFVSKLETQYPALNTAPTDTALILVLGAGHIDVNGRPHNSVLEANALARLMEGVRLWKTTPHAALAVSGAGEPGASLSHAQAMKNMALTMGVPENKIVTFENTRDTADEIRTAVGYMENIKQAATPPQRLIIVSSATHLPRAALMLRASTVPHTMAPTDFLTGNSSRFSSSSTALRNFERALHEWIGMLWFRIRQAI